MDTRHEFESMKYKARGGGSLQGRPRVFFCCAAADFKRLFEPVTEEILSIRRNAVIWYVDPEESTMEGKAFLEDLSQVQLLVVPVTTAFLRQDKPDPARTVAFAYAVANGIPVLPLMQEPGLEQIFNEVCGNLMVLDKTAQQQDPTAAPYEEKLRRFLEGLLVSDELTKRVKDAFDAFIFLSYRKKDRASAQKIMRLLHENDFCRDVAIWYDEFLKPGEDFNEAIFKMIEKSALYTLVVTERLLEMPNYVQSTEYQEALRQNKPILPLEDRATVREKLKILYDKLPECLKTEDHAKIAETLHEILRSAKDVTLRENNTPEHTFLIGIAYLSGLFVEVDHDRGAKLITEAAEAGLPEALEKLVMMYKTGEGVERNYYSAIAWQEKLVEILYEKVQRELTEESHDLYFWALCKLADEKQQVGAFEEAESIYFKAKEFIESLLLTEKFDKLLWNYMASLLKLADNYRRLMRINEAKEWYQKILMIAEKAADKTEAVKMRRYLGAVYDRLCDMSLLLQQSEEALNWCKKSMSQHKDLLKYSDAISERMDLASSYMRMGDVCQIRGELIEAVLWYEKGLAIDEKLEEQNDQPSILHTLAVDYDKLGDLNMKLVNMEEALLWYLKCVDILEKIANETETIDSYRELSIGCIKVGDVKRESSEWKEALKWYQKSAELNERVVANAKTSEARKNLSISYFRIGDLLKKILLLEDSLRWYQRGVKIREDLLKDVNTVETQQDLALGYLNLGIANRELDCPEEALLCLNKSLRLFEKLEMETDTRMIRQRLATNYEEIGDVYLLYMSNPEEASVWYRKSSSIRQLLLNESATIMSRRELFSCYHRLGKVAFQRGQFDEALEWQEKAYSIAEPLEKETKTVKDRVNLSLSFVGIGDAYNALNQLEEALEWYAKSVELSGELISKDKTRATLEHFASVFYKIAMLPIIQDDDKKACAERMLQISEYLFSTTGLSRYLSNIDAANAILGSLDEDPF